MGGLEILLLLVGAVAGAGLMYWWQENRITKLKTDHKRALRKAIENAEREKMDLLAKNTYANLTDGVGVQAQQVPEQIQAQVPEQIQAQQIRAQVPEQIQGTAPTPLQSQPPTPNPQPPSPGKGLAFEHHAPTQTFRRPLQDKIAAWGQIASPSYISQLLPYANHPSPSVREDVAKVLGQIAITHNLHAYLELVIPILANLSRDRHPETSYQAIITLGRLKSERVIPILTAALRHPSSRIAKVASSALERLKYYAPNSNPQAIAGRKRVVYKKPVR